MSRSVTGSFSNVKQYSFPIPPSRTNGKVVAPPPSAVSYYLSLLRSGFTGTADLINSVSNIHDFDWRNPDCVQKYAINQKIYVSAKPKTWAVNDRALATATSATCGGAPPPMGTQSYINKAVDQGQCGNCWAFSTATAISDCYAIQNDKDNSTGQVFFSPSIITACTTANSAGCNGGMPFDAGQWVQTNGIQLNSSCTLHQDTGNYSDQDCVNNSGCCNCQTIQSTYNPYQNPPYFPIAKDQTLQLPGGTTGKIDAVITLTAFYDTDKTTDTLKLYEVPLDRQLTDPERQKVQQYMKAHLISNGPFVIAFFVDDAFEQYQPGTIFVDNSAAQFPVDSGNAPNHAVTVIGFGRDTGSNQDYWIVMNSWGEAWGNAGTFKFAFSSNANGKAVNVNRGLDVPVVVAGGDRSDISQRYLSGGGTAFLIDGQSPIDSTQPIPAQLAGLNLAGLSTGTLSALIGPQGIASLAPMYRLASTAQPRGTAVIVAPTAARQASGAYCCSQSSCNIVYPIVIGVLLLIIIIAVIVIIVRMQAEPYV